ncbi:hypothetical protein [Flavobacterium sp. 3HN19-14]|uniref:hypothetical protein n=1 Tax=Flavobacterium sp. 3HN19-14 TaxID=3448133 RepID=UPI003EE3275B
MEKLKTILVVVDAIDIEASSGAKANVAIIKNLRDTGFEVLVYHYTRKILQSKALIVTLYLK